MKGIKFKAAYGDQDREAVISQVSGSLNGIHIYVNDYYQGTINCIMGKWVVHWRQPTEKSATRDRYGLDDTEAILDRLRDVGWIE